MFLAVVAWVTITRVDVQAGDNAESQDHPHGVPVFAGETD
jgi:hypothetical protein